MKRKSFAILLAFSMIFTCVIPVLDSDWAAHAYTTKTRDEAIEWVQSQLGVGIDYDGVYGNQCVDLIKAYYAYLGVGAVLGNGADYATNSLPSGWSRVEGGIPEKGDILVYAGNDSNIYGHVAIYESDFETYHQNFNSHGYVEKVTAYRYTAFSNQYWGYIRPDWAEPVGPTDPPYDMWWQIDREATVTDVRVPKDQMAADFTVIISKRFSDSKRKLRADWYAGQNGQFAEDTPRFREEKIADEDATAFTFTVPLDTIPEDYNTFECVIRELLVDDETETTINSEEIIFYLIRESDPSDPTDPSDPGQDDPSNPGQDNPSNPGQVDPSNPGQSGSGTVTPAKKPSAPKEVKDLKALKIKRLKAAKKKATVSWKKLTKKEKSKIQGIEVQWSTNKFKTIAGRKTVKKTKTSLTIKGLKSKKKYWVRIRTYKKINGTKHVSAWKTKTVRIK